MKTCKKCESANILTTYIMEGILINSSASTPTNADNEFINSSEYPYYYKQTAKKGHLFKQCCDCQYSWRENTADTLKDLEHEGRDK